MAHIMFKEYSLRSRPYLSLEKDIDRVFYKDNSKLIQLRFTLVNVGNVPVAYFLDDVRLNQTQIAPDKKPLILLPHQRGLHASRAYESKKDITEQGGGMEGSIKVVFWAEGLSNDKYFFTRSFRLNPGTSVHLMTEQFGKMD
jgi:hypothetical protein